MTRCSNPRQAQWRDYGGRGITVCERWHVFGAFLEDMGERPPGRSLDRIDNNGNYEPSNCRWATSSEQRRNSRQRTAPITAWGRTLLAGEWARLCGIGRTTIEFRIYRLGWSPEEAVTTRPAFTGRKYR